MPIPKNAIDINKPIEIDDKAVSELEDKYIKKEDNFNANSLRETSKKLDNIYEDFLEETLLEGNSNNIKNSEIEIDFAKIQNGLEQNGVINTDKYLNYIKDKYKNLGHDNKDRYSITHVHHIWPTSLGGPNDDWNKIRLTRYEHIRAHAILALNNPECLAAQDAFLKIHRAEDYVTAAEYNKIVKQEARLKSRKYAGEDNPNYGNHISDIKKQEMSTNAQSSSQNSKAVVVEYVDGHVETYNSVAQAANALFGENSTKTNIRYTDPKKQLQKFLNGRQKFNSKWRDGGIQNITYLEPDAYLAIGYNNSSKPVIGIPSDLNKNEIYASSVRKAARELIAIYGQEYYKNYEDPIRTLASNISSNAENNKATNSKRRNSYRQVEGYYWVWGDSSPQLIGLIKKFIKEG